MFVKPFRLRLVGCSGEGYNALSPLILPEGRLGVNQGVGFAAILSMENQDVNPMQNEGTMLMW